MNDCQTSSGANQRTVASVDDDRRNDKERERERERKRSKNRAQESEANTKSLKHTLSRSSAAGERVCVCV